MAQMKKIDEIKKDIEKFPLPEDIFSSYHLQALKYEYLRYWEPAVREILAALGFREDHIDKICKERLSNYQPGVLHVDFGKDNTPKYFYEVIKQPSKISELKEWLKNEAKFKTWEVVISEILAPNPDESVETNEVFELEFCLLLDMVYNLLISSKSAHLLGVVEGKDVVKLIKRDFSEQLPGSSFAKMIAGQLNKKNKAKIKFCDHKHYLRDVISKINKKEDHLARLSEDDLEEFSKNNKKEDHLRRLSEDDIEEFSKNNKKEDHPNRLSEDDLKEFRFSKEDSDWNKIREESNKSFDANSIASSLLKTLPDYYYKIAKSTINRINRRRNIKTGREYAGLYCQMPYFYISEWLIGAEKASLKASKEDGAVLSLCPLVGKEYTSYQLRRYVENGAIDNFNRISSCNMGVDFNNEVSMLSFLAHDKAYEATGSNVSKLDRRITQFCLFQYLVGCIERFNRIIQTGINAKLAAAPLDEKMTGADTGRLTDEYLAEIFRVELLVNKLKFFEGYQSYLKRMIVASYDNDKKIEGALKDIKSTLFWNTFLYYLLKRAKYKTISPKDIVKVKNAYAERMASVSDGGVELLYDLAKTMCELNNTYKFTNTGSQFLSVIKNLLNKTLNETLLEGDSWDSIDEILEKVYRKRERHNNKKAN